MKMGTTFLTVMLLLGLVIFPVTGSALQQEIEKKPGTEAQEKPETELFQPPLEPVVTPTPTPDPAMQPLDLGRVYFPRDFFHAKKEYKRGVYRLKLISKESLSYFQVYDKKGELLFEEMGVVKPYKSRSKRFKFRLRRTVLKDYEYFRLIVIQPNRKVFAHFLLKQPKSVTPVKKAEEKKEDLSAGKEK